jgi:hypothetical protein
MLVDLSRMIGTYLQDVFVKSLDWWVVLGLCRTSSSNLLTGGWSSD